MTIATVHSEQFRGLLAARGPFVSVYFDDSHDVHDAAVRLGAKWRDVARELENQGADARLVSLVEGAVLEAPPSVGRSGRGLVATADGIIVDEHFAVPPPTPVVRSSELPYLVPFVEYGPVLQAYVVVAVDHTGADISLYQRNTVRTETIEAGAHPVHKVANAENYGWGAQEHRVEEAIRKNVRAVANALTEQCDHYGPEAVFVIGQDRVRAKLVSVLPERISALVVRPRVGARDTGVDDTVRHAIALEFQNRGFAAANNWARRFRAEAGRRSGLAVEGLTAVSAALREETVATLILGNLGQGTVLTGDDPTMVATDADALSAYGVPPTRTLRADEAIPFAALARGANLVRASEDLNARDGVAALLRYAAVVA
ncbi:MAG: hypothetical protein ABW001_07795 [Mycobacterium sp.]